MQPVTQVFTVTFWTIMVQRKACLCRVARGRVNIVSCHVCAAEGGERFLLWGAVAVMGQHPWRPGCCSQKSYMVC